MFETIAASTVAGAALAGLAGSAHCIGMCGGFSAATAQHRGGALAWSAGRLTTYGLLGAVAGGTTAALPLPAWFGQAFAIVLLLWFAAGLAAIPLPRLPTPAILHRAGGALLRRSDLPSRYAFGLVTGLLPCGLVYAALSLAVASASATTGALAMVAFGLGTVPALALATAGLRRLVAGSLLRRRVLALAVLLVGISAVAGRPGAIDLGAADAATEAPPCPHHP